MYRHREMYELGEFPPLGVVPKYMKAATIRPESYGKPADAFAIEDVPVPSMGPHQVLVLVMAAGINHNSVWASQGKPLDVIKLRQKMGQTEDFHIGGSDASGIVWAVGEAVRHVKPGAPVVISTAAFNPRAIDALMGGVSIYSQSSLAWGYEVNYGAFGQFTLVEEYQCFSKPENLTWEAAACYMLCAGTAYRQLMGWHPNVVTPGAPVLIWGGAGGLGSMAIQITKAFGGIPIAVVSNEERKEHCLRLGAKGVINRNDFDHWGDLPVQREHMKMKRWTDGVRAFYDEYKSQLGDSRKPKIVFEHSGAGTLPTSVFMCDTGGMVTICGATTGYIGTLDLRYLWMRSKRLQGSHGAELKEYAAVNQLVADGRIDPCLSYTESFENIGAIHQMMHDNQHPPGNLAVLVNAPEKGLRSLPADLSIY
ncbi:MAG: crotonyl-CoA carboxylase/reductase [Proteobacteria bacterium]|nr:crotonyl-CoA carboxylase/reductase [Pseudomonadota bacterium]